MECRSISILQQAMTAQHRCVQGPIAERSENSATCHFFLLLTVFFETAFCPRMCFLYILYRYLLVFFSPSLSSTFGFFVVSIVLSVVMNKIWNCLFGTTRQEPGSRLCGYSSARVLTSNEDPRPPPTTLISSFFYLSSPVHLL